MQRYYKEVLDTQGNPASGVSVLVTDSATGATATLYQDYDGNLDSTVGMSNPFVTGSDGKVHFAAANGRYTISYSGSNITAFSESWVTLFDAAGGYLTTGTLAQFQPTTSAQLAGVITDETGSGKLVFGTGPTITNATLTASTVNLLTLTQPATGATFTLADGKTATVNNTLTLAGTDGSTVTFGTGGTVAYTSNKLSAFAATSSLELLGVISDETGTGPLVFGTAPSLTTPNLLGGAVIDKTSGVGIKVDTAAPTYAWRDMTGEILSRAGGAAAPTYTAYRGNIYGWSFGTGTATVEVFNDFHMLHDYAPNTDMFIHTHWSTISGTTTGAVQWMFDILYAKGHSQAVFEGTVGSGSQITVSVTQSAITAFEHMIAEVQFSTPGGLINPGVNVSIASGAATVTAAAALWTAADVGKTIRVLGAGASAAVLDTTISSFTSTTQIALATNAATTVTNQDAFRYRVLDTSNLEVDGILMVRTWRNSTQVADTISVAPFIHYVDIHYQSTGIGTKQKAPPFYT